MDFGGFNTNMTDGLPFKFCYPNGFQDFHHFDDPLDVYPSTFNSYLTNKDLLRDNGSQSVVNDYQDVDFSGEYLEVTDNRMQLNFHLASSMIRDVKPLMAIGPPDELSFATGGYGSHGGVDYMKCMDMKRTGGRNQKNPNAVKGQWTSEEDRLLVRLVEQFGLRKWSLIARMLSGRIGKQCRERWHNHLRPNIKKDTWSEEEDKILIQAHSEIGNKWAEIAKRISGRTENSIKNHWNATKRRQFTRRRSRSSKHPKSGSLLQNYIKSLSSASPSTTITESWKNSINNKSNEFIGGPNEKACHVMATSATDVHHRLVPPCEYFSDMPDLLLDGKAVLTDDVGYIFNPIGCGLGSTGDEKGFEIEVDWEPFESLERDVDLAEMINNNRKE